VSAVVPATREGLLNARSARLILESWRARRVLDPSAVDAALAILGERTASAHTKDAKEAKMGRGDILRRIEEDREILPIPPLRGTGNPSPASPSPFALTPASPKPGAERKRKREEREMPPPRAPVVQPLDVEFEQMWEGTSDLDDDDYERMHE
jgi:CTD kinase subunit gamma